jgi:hypothetical protein
LPRYTRDGKRIVNRPVRHEVPAGLLAGIDGLAVKVVKLQRDRDSLQDHARRLEHQAYRAGFAADTATVPGLRKALNDQAVRLQRQAAAARFRLGRAERDLGGQMRDLRDMHTVARAYRRGELSEDDEDD